MDSRPVADTDDDDPRKRARRVQRYATRAAMGLEALSGQPAEEAVLPAYRGCCTQPGLEDGTVVRYILIDLVSDLATHCGLVDRAGGFSWPVAAARSRYNPYPALAGRFCRRALELVRMEAARGQGAPVRVVLSGEAPVYLYVQLVLALRRAGLAVMVEEPYCGRMVLEPPRGCGEQLK